MYENIAEAYEILKGGSIGSDEFSLSVYPSSQPVYKALVDNGYIGGLMDAGAIVKTAFCGPCFGAGDVPANNGLSIRHTTRAARGANPRRVSLRQSRSWTRARSRRRLQTAANSLRRRKRIIPKKSKNISSIRRSTKSASTAARGIRTRMRNLSTARTSPTGRR